MHSTERYAGGDGHIGTQEIEEEEKDDTFSKQTIERDLWDQGISTLLASEKPGLWVFCFSEAKKQVALEILQLNGLACKCPEMLLESLLNLSGVSSGHLKPTDISGSGGTGRRTNNATISSQRHAEVPTESNKYSIEQSASRQPLLSLDDVKKYTPVVSDIYPKMLLAVTRNAIYRLSKKKSFMLNGFATCIDTKTLSDYIFEQLDLSLVAQKTTVISCNTRWLHSGTMLIIFTVKHIPLLCTVPYIVSTSGESTALQPGDLLSLSPSGIVGQYLGFEKLSKSDIFENSKERLKKRTFAGLKSIGLTVPQPTQWVQVLVETGERDTDSCEAPTKAAKTSRMILWPAQLCLCSDVRYSADSLKGDVLAVSTDPKTDPLDRAQSWYIDRHVRAVAIERQRHAAEEEQKRAKEAEHIDNEEAVSDFYLQVSQDITPRDVSGIYPTPPDGVPSAVHDAIMDSNPTSIGNATDAIGPTTDGGISRAYKSNKSDDLFGDIDIDLFATNGLTEDDFSFFDQPDVDEGKPQSSIDPMFVDGESAFVEEQMSAEASALPLDDYTFPMLLDPQDVATTPELGLDQTSEL